MEAAQEIAVKPADAPAEKPVKIKRPATEKQMASLAKARETKKQNEALRRAAKEREEADLVERVKNAQLDQTESDEVKPTWVVTKKSAKKLSKRVVAETPLEVEDCEDGCDDIPMERPKLVRQKAETVPKAAAKPKSARKKKVIVEEEEEGDEEEHEEITYVTKKGAKKESAAALPVIAGWV